MSKHVCSIGVKRCEEIVFPYQILCIWLLSVIIASTNSYSQSIPRVKISGKVVDTSNGTPLHYADVFLSNSTMGAATDEEGFFTIVNVPLGMYELVVSMMGYELSTMRIHLTESTDKEYFFRLKPKVLQAPVIEVIGRYPREWKNNFKEFRRLFLGTSKNASECKILNPEVLDFKNDKESGTFVASASQPLEIENRTLGYRIYFYLKDFKKGEYQLNYKGNTVFELLHPKNEKEKKKWKRNCLEAYYGSFSHFLSALVSNRLSEEGFFIRNVFRLSKSDKGFYANNITVNELLSPGRQSFERRLSFKNYLRVIYTKEEEAIEYKLFHNKKDQNIHQISWIKMNKKIPVIINSSGHISDGYALTTYGYWAWERFAEWLPLDYSPDNTSK